MNILVTGAAGFIGAHVLKHLSLEGHHVIGIDNINDYYDTSLKFARLQQCGFNTKEAAWQSNIVRSTTLPSAEFIRMDIDDKNLLDSLFDRYAFDKVVNLAAQAGVRYSISNPYSYLRSNMDGFLNILECCRHHHTPHLIFASSSSVYGTNAKVPFQEDSKTETPVSLYAASKKADELMAYSYSNLYGIRTTGLRYFTVYGPWGRPDMAPMLFASAILHGKTIDIYNNGDMLRDFTYIDDIVEGTIKLILNDDQQKHLPLYNIFNIGCAHPVKLMDFVSLLEKSLGITAQKQFLPMQPGDVYQTYADVSKLQKATGFIPHIQLEEGIKRFAQWFKIYYHNDLPQQALA